MNLSDLLSRDNFDPRDVIVLRHRPFEPEMARVLPWLAAEHPDQFNAYQQTQGEKLEAAMQIRLEATWKARLHIYSPHGLNDN